MPANSGLGDRERDVLFALRQGLPENTEITGVDFCEPMLQEARNKREAKGLKEETNEFLGDCLSLDFPDESFDLVTISFGLTTYPTAKRD